MTPRKTVTMPEAACHSAWPGASTRRMGFRSFRPTTPQPSSGNRTHGSTGFRRTPISNGLRTCRRPGMEFLSVIGTETHWWSKRVGSTDSRTIQHTFTVHDPKAYTHDWMNVRTWIQRPANDVIMEYSCEENNLGLE